MCCTIKRIKNFPVITAAEEGRSMQQGTKTYKSSYNEINN
ncbi:10125_t:CDS:2 [Entrophospora sp. SA101]|nr:10125_t:CDS:2 [Entrophospora sp. SA101]